MRLNVIIGHSKNNPGAFAPGHADSEYSYNLDLGIKMREYAEKFNIHVNLITKDGLKQNEVVRAVNLCKPDLIMELHCNAFNKKAMGSTVLCLNDDKLSYFYGFYIQTDLALALGRVGKDDRGVKILNRNDRGFMNLIGFESPICITEAFFIDSPCDYELGLRMKKDIAKSLVMSSNDFYNSTSRSFFM